MNKNPNLFDFDGDGDLDFFDYMMYKEIVGDENTEEDEEDEIDEESDDD